MAEIVCEKWFQVKIRKMVTKTYRLKNSEPLYHRSSRNILHQIILTEITFGPFQSDLNPS